MPRVPHVYIPPPWEGAELALPEPTAHHLARVLRLRPGAAVSYTDGQGTTGTGTLGAGAVARGTEQAVARPAPGVTLAVAAPHRAERSRFVVEKAAELGVDRLVWLATARGSLPPRPERAAAWAIAALEQSRGAHLLDVGGPTPLGDLDQPLWVADIGGGRPQSVAIALTVAVGPEGGWNDGEVGPDAVRISLGARVLRVETAAVAAGILALQAVGRLPAPA